VLLLLLLLQLQVSKALQKGATNGSEARVADSQRTAIMYMTADKCEIPPNIVMPNPPDSVLLLLQHQVSEALQKGAAYHIAHKSIPSKDGPVKGIKLELFIFDTFPLADSVSLFEVRSPPSAAQLLVHRYRTATAQLLHHQCTAISQLLHSWLVVSVQLLHS
jgi:hypothetical protein